MSWNKNSGCLACFVKRRAKMDAHDREVAATLNKMLSLDQVDGNTEGVNIFTQLVNVNMVGSGVALKAAIATHEGVIYAASQGLDISQEQIAALVTAIRDPGTLAVTGILLGAEQYAYTSSKGATVHGRHGDQYCTVAATKNLILVGIYVREKQEEAEEMLKDLQKYFKNQGM